MDRALALVKDACLPAPRQPVRAASVGKMERFEAVVKASIVNSG